MPPENSLENVSQIASELGLRREQVEATVKLLSEGATVPFIARYRKEATGSIDEVAVTSIRDRLAQLQELQKRRFAIISSLTERALLTPDLEQQINAGKTLVELEDIYLPYRLKRRTKASMAREKGLEPLAQAIYTFATKEPQVLAQSYLTASVDAQGQKLDNAVATVEEALSGARDIIAENINEDKKVRTIARKYWSTKSEIRSSVVSKKQSEAGKYQDYFDWFEPAQQAPSHRLLALFRGEKEGMLNVEVVPPYEPLLAQLESLLIPRSGACAEQIKMALADSYKRLLAPSLETEIRGLLKERADTEAIKVFADNIRQLLLAAPLGQVNVLAVDPGFRTGCKLACLDAQGQFLHHDVMYWTGVEAAASPEQTEAGRKVLAMLEKYAIGAIAIGNGTASRETESFLKKLLNAASVKTFNNGKKIPIVIVSESGASIYSASELAREEFPALDLTVRGAISIGRRLMDPLAELVKVEPKSIGVGQYQHDVDQVSLKASLDDVVVSCVNSVGVELNTASKQLLTYVSGLGPQLASNIVKYRDENGPFGTRADLKKVPRLGAKAYEQAAGFLRIRSGGNPLDESAVHPESYSVVDAMAKELKCAVKDLMTKDELRKRINVKQFVTAAIGLPTLTDIMNELARPGRDPREQFEAFDFKEGVNEIKDLEVGMLLPGIVTNVTAFGAFVDIGVHQDGLVHVSELSNTFVKNPGDVVKVQQKVTVKVMSVDKERKRIGLSMKNLAAR